VLAACPGKQYRKGGALLETPVPTNFITLARSELYERVWSKPVTEVAAEFGISDVALAKPAARL